MKSFSKQHLFPWLSLFTGAIGLILRYWLFSTMDHRGLLPKYHISSILTFLLFALTLGLLIYVLKTTAPSTAYRQLFPPSPVAAGGILVSAIAFLHDAFTVQGTSTLQLLLPTTGIVGALALMIIAYYRLVGQRPNCLLHGAAILFLIFRTLICCQNWGSQPQLQLYLFPLLASVCLLLAFYFRAEADAIMGDYRRYVFFAQTALFCCCLSLPGEDWLFYLSAGIWVATDFCLLPEE
jgi:hypothetical protein